MLWAFFISSGSSTIFFLEGLIRNINYIKFKIKENLNVLASPKKKKKT